MAFAILLITTALTCSLQAAPYTNNSPLLVGAQALPQLCAIANACTYTSMTILMTGNFGLIGSGNTVGSWQPGFTPNQDGLPYLDGNSPYSTQIMNLASYAYGTGGFTGSSTSPNWTPANSQYFGTNAGGAAGFRFQQNSGSNSAELVVRISLLEGLLNMYWRDPSVPNVLYSILDPTNGVGDVVAFVPSTIWELVFFDGTSNMASGNNAANKAFVVMQGPPDQQTGVPEPITLVLMGAGLVGIALFRRRHHNGA